MYVHIHTFGCTRSPKYWKLNEGMEGFVHTIIPSNAQCIKLTFALLPSRGHEILSVAVELLWAIAILVSRVSKKTHTPPSVCEQHARRAVELLLNDVNARCVA